MSDLTIINSNGVIVQPEYNLRGTVYFTPGVIGDTSGTSPHYEFQDDINIFNIIGKSEGKIKILNFNAPENGNDNTYYHAKIKNTSKTNTDSELIVTAGEIVTIAEYTAYHFDKSKYLMYYSKNGVDNWIPFKLIYTFDIRES